MFGPFGHSGVTIYQIQKLVVRIAHFAKPDQKVFFKICKILQIFCLAHWFVCCQILCQNRIVFIFLQYNGPHCSQAPEYTLMQ
jgi:hypothetical protein